MSETGSVRGLNLGVGMRECIATVCVYKADVVLTHCHCEVYVPDAGKVPVIMLPYSVTNWHIRWE